MGAQPMLEISWPIVGVITSVVGALVGIGAGWGVMRSVTQRLTQQWDKFSGAFTELMALVTTLKADHSHVANQVNDIANRLRTAEIEIATLKAGKKE
jgi:uncharacterized membrane protein AbrB (regulator of aidB expression)